MNKSIDEIDFEKSDGLVPVIVQDANTKDVLTLAYSNAIIYLVEPSGPACHTGENVCFHHKLK
jgi:phosphoribosyl-AMP cyclohydrolase